jgi:hypothetical protein
VTRRLQRLIYGALACLCAVGAVEFSDRNMTGLAVLAGAGAAIWLFFATGGGGHG